jgi:Protein of unknown function (DUF1329)
MKRRDFGLLAGTSLATAVVTPPARAQSAKADPTLLSTSLTPMGGERAGNADGSIPAWTGGVVLPPVPSDQNVIVRLFTDEQPLYTVNASNMAQYQNLLTPGTQAQIKNFGLSIDVYPTHRTAAAPQYVYDNIAKNVTRASFEPSGGRFGFLGAYGGIPFPIIDTSDPLVGGSQLIWNHLTAWVGYSAISTFSPGSVVINGRLILVSGSYSRTIYPYYDPDGTAETFAGYYSKGHYYDKAPGSVNGQETLVWHTTNVNVHPDIVWTLLNGQGRVRKAPNEAFDATNPDSNGIADIDESSGFYGNPSQYNWTYVGKQEMLVPYNCNEMSFRTVPELLGANFPDPKATRWEKHRVWVLEADLAPGEHNVNSRRRFYIDEDTWYILLGEGFDGLGNMVKAYINYISCVPTLPGTIEFATSTCSLVSGDYTYNGNNSWPPFFCKEYDLQQEDAFFEPQEMAAKASF